MFGNLGFGELMVIMVIVLVLFGAKRVPEISASFGKGIREFKKNMSDVESSITSAPESARFDSRPSPMGADLHDAAPTEQRAEPKRLL